MKKKLVILLSIFCLFFNLFAEEKDIEGEKVNSLFNLIVSENSEEDICNIINQNKYSKKDINEQDNNGYTPLYLAIDTGKVHVLDLLIKKGANKNQIVNLTLRDKSGKTILRTSPVLYASWKGDINCLQFLLDKGSKTDIESDIIIPAGDNPTYLRLLTPIDAAFYNRKQINFNEIHKILLSKEIDYQHIHYSGKKWAYTRIKTYDLLKEYELLEIK